MLLALLLAASRPTSRPPPPPTHILFIGNSFTFGARSPVQQWGAASVTDLNADGVGGVPALVKRFADEAGWRVEVSLETSPGKSLEWHWVNKRALLDRRWDRVVMQEYSTLDADRPGDPAKLALYSGRFATLFRARNRRVRMGIAATWSRPDLTYPPGKPWSGKSIFAMADDLARGVASARATNPAIGATYPVGAAFGCAVRKGVADANPYDGTAAGQVDLWASDHYHASTAGYYLEALTLYAGLSGRDPRALGGGEGAASELGLAPELAARLQGIAHEVTSADGCRVKR